jgi:putative oxidoreductase
MNALTTVVARVLFALPFGIFGILHFLSVPRISKMVPLPAAEFWVYFTGAALIAGSLGMILKVQAKWAALGLALLMLLFILFVHGPGAFDPAQRTAQLPQVLKNLSLMAGALTWAGIFARGEAK